MQRRTHIHARRERRKPNRVTYAARTAGGAGAARGPAAGDLIRVGREAFSKSKASTVIARRPAFKKRCNRRFREESKLAHVVRSRTDSCPGLRRPAVIGINVAREREDVRL
ncbi:hypothetical protein EVAR_29206_1 [Eumeta japonica]|uniref:Uncharacterized protein n=1 Tax=Eumeta variegata TaxID=151549 RepID=A0A4C1VHY4_EUMVA|nr:hypothetical protein EVAR_29206_1 [Eumeta japonica]